MKQIRNNEFRICASFQTRAVQRGKPVIKLDALTRNFSHGVHTFSLNLRQ